MRREVSCHAVQISTTRPDSDNTIWVIQNPETTNVAEKNMKLDKWIPSHLLSIIIAFEFYQSIAVFST